jgi:transposase InsO family protein
VLPIAPSTYHWHQARRRDPELRCERAKRDDVLRLEIERAWKANYGVYGKRKIWHQLRRDGQVVGRCTVEHLMRQMGLQGAVRGKKFRTTIPDISAARPPDLLQRNFAAMGPNQLWVADFTYVWTATGFVFVAFVIDVFSRKIVGWRVSRRLQTDLVLDALEQAIYARPQLGGGLVHHSDRGSRGGFKRSSQHLTGGSCDGNAKASMFGSSWARQVAIARPAVGGTV